MAKDSVLSQPSQALTSTGEPHDTSSAPVSPVSLPARAKANLRKHEQRDRTTPLQNVEPGTNDAPNRPHLSLHLDSERLKNSFSPETHDLLKKEANSSSTTDRLYDRNVQRRRLWRLSIIEWVTTLCLCVAIFGCLWYFHTSTALSTSQINWFNTIITGLSIALGLNLTASLKSYARMMRWRVLMARYRPLDEFEAIMSCDQLVNVTWLLFRTWGTRVRFLPSLTGLVCVLWIVINVAATILVASLGLTYSLNPSPSLVNIDNGGLTSVANLSSINYAVNNGSDINYQGQLIAAQQYGITGQFFNVAQGINLEDAVGIGSINQDPTASGHYRYFFIDENPQNLNLQADAAISGRFIDSRATCSGFPVVAGAYGNLSYIIYSDDGRNVTQKVGGQGEPGAMTYISQLDSTCGPRCTQVKAFQSMYPLNTDGLGVVKEPHFFICNSTVTIVQDLIGSDIYSVGDDVQVPDQVARILAGAIGWTGSKSANSTEEAQTYAREAPECYTVDVNAIDIEAMVAVFSIATVAAIDDHGPRKTVPGGLPVVANILDLGRNWREAGSILAVIPTIHFLAMIAVLIWADKAIILDNSFLSAAKFLKPMMDRLQTKGNLMRGSDIVRKLENPRVKYGWRYTDGNVLHADIYEESTGVVVGPEFRAGAYD